MNNADLFKRFVIEAFGRGDLEVVDELISPEFVEHQFGSEGEGLPARENVKKAITSLHGFLHGLHYTFDDMVTTGDTVWARMTATGTHSGPFLGIPASGRPIKITVVDICRFRDGQMVEHWGVPDRFAMMAQIGALQRLRAE